MRIPKAATDTASGLFLPMATVFLQDTLRTMLPWIIVMLSVIICDLVAGIRRSLKLDIHVAWTMACRETMGKMVTYVAFVMMVAMIDVASGHEFKVAMWGCFFVCAIEAGSIVSNMLEPYGIDITPQGVIKAFVKSKFGVADTDADELVRGDKREQIRQREKDRWERHHKYRHGASVEHMKNKNK